MTMRTLIALAAALVLLPTAGLADQQNLQFGGDNYVAGDIVTLTQPTGHDAFIAGRDVDLAAPVGSTAHLAGFNVVTTGDVAGSVYAAGFNVSIGGSVKGDVTAFGNSVSLNTASPLTGSARMIGQTVKIDSAVEGAVLAVAQSMGLNKSVAGDLSFYGENMTFGPDARVDGQLLIHAPKPIDVPPSVASKDRVVYTEMKSPQAPTDIAQNAAASFEKGTWLAVWGAVIWWLCLFVVGTLFVVFGQGLVGRYEILSASGTVRRIGTGILAFAALVGLVPVLALTIIGLVLVPFVVLVAFVGWSLAYLAGTYLVGYQVVSRITTPDTTWRRIGVLAVSLLVAGILSMIPFIGWLVSLLLVIFGFGIVAALMMTRWSDADRTKLFGAASPVAA